MKKEKERIRCFSVFARPLARSLAWFAPPFSSPPRLRSLLRSLARSFVRSLGPLGSFARPPSACASENEQNSMLMRAPERMTIMSSQMTRHNQGNTLAH